MEEKKKVIEKILAEYVEPQLAQHGGSLCLTDVRDNVAYVRFTGRCSGCPSTKYTMETIVKEEVLKRTDAVEDVRHELYEYARAILRHEIQPGRKEQV